MKAITSGLIGLLMLTVGTTAQAVPIMHDESVDGSVESASPYVLDVGANNWMGTVFTPDDSTDIWTAMLQAGQEIVGIRWQWSATDPNAVNTLTTFEILDPFSSNIVDHRAPASGVQDIVDSGFSILDPTLPQTTVGPYIFDIIAGTISPAASWSVTVTVAEAGTVIPEPGTALLLGTGLLGLLAVGRRRRRRAAA